MAPSRRTPETATNTRPAVYGYVRSDGTDEATVASLRADLALFCAERGWRLVTVFCDRGCDGSDTARPGFAGALDALVLPESTALVVPSPAHLSPDATVRAVLASMVRRAGAKIAVVEATHGTTDTTADTGTPR